DKLPSLSSFITITLLNYTTLLCAAQHLLPQGNIVTAVHHLSKITSFLCPPTMMFAKGSQNDVDTLRGQTMLRPTDTK
ncbi:MAG: hypothetical protein IJZ21_03505, partial [Clostridia bacterium]|nr:hypothetical protein [Clostridia bacterium]